MSPSGDFSDAANDAYTVASIDSDSHSRSKRTLVQYEHRAFAGA